MAFVLDEKTTNIKAMTIPHGTQSGYSYWGCRCEACVEVKHAANNAYYHRTKKPPKERVVKPIQHGTDGGYSNRKCRCDLCREAHRMKALQYTRANAERTRERMLASYYRRKAADPEKMLAKARAYSKTSKAQLANRLKAHNRRGAKADVVARDWAELILKDPCVYCGAPATEIDHIVPVSHGGTGDWMNLAPACRTCNASKNDQELLPFLLRKAA